MKIDNIFNPDINILYLKVMTNSPVHRSKELIEIEKLIFETYELKIFNLKKNKECCEYLGYNFQIENQQVKFRKAKVTPKKIGQFVTLWKRNLTGETTPFDINDEFDFYIIMVNKADQWGVFVFSKEILANMGILSANGKVGKRGFRIYPEWDAPVSCQALRTKKGQSAYFIELGQEKKTNDKLKSICTLSSRS